VCHRPADEGALDAMGEDVLDQLASGASAQSKLDLGKPIRVIRKDRRQPQRQRRLERAERERALGLPVVGDRLSRILEELRDLHSIGQPALPGFSERHAPAVAVKQARAELVFELTDARGDVRLHGIEFRRRSVHATEPRDCLENPQIAGIHCAIRSPGPLETTRATRMLGANLRSAKRAARGCGAHCSGGVVRNSVTSVSSSPGARSDTAQ
jgi:hypothetical protein